MLNKFGKWYKTIILFFLIYNVKFIHIPFFSTWKISFFLFFVLYLKKNKEKLVFHGGLAGRHARVRWCIQIILYMFIMIYAYWRASVNGLLSSVYLDVKLPFLFVILGLFTPVILTSVFGSLDEFMKALIGISIAQSLFCFVEFRCMPLKIWLDSHIVSTNISFLGLDRARGLGGEGAALSVMLFWGVFASCYFIITDKHHIKYWFYILIIFCAQFLVGRTGIYLDLIFLAVTVLILNKKRKTLKKSLMCIWAVILLLALFNVVGLKWTAVKKYMYSSNLAEAFDRNTNPERQFGKKSSLATLLSLDIPELNIDSLLGYGVRRGELGNGQVCNNDSGYIMRVLQCGYILAFISYISLFAYLLFLWRTTRGALDITLRMFFFLLIPLLFIIEIKEPFIYYHYYVNILTCCLVLCSILKQDKGCVWIK